MTDLRQPSHEHEHEKCRETPTGGTYCANTTHDPATQP